MKIAFFGGTFDPVHHGHLAVARAAVKGFGLDFVYFAPADIPPHKQERELTPFQHRYAMLALATFGEERFVPSLLDAYTGRPNYSIETVRRLKSSLARSDKLYFLIGIDAFRDISTWRKPVALLAECEFIVAARPGFSLRDIGLALPPSIRQPEKAWLTLSGEKRSTRTVALPGATIHLLDDVNEPVSSTQIRAAASRPGNDLVRLVPQTVAEYIRKEHLYVGRSAPRGKMLSWHRGAAKEPQARMNQSLAKDVRKQVVQAVKAVENKKGEDVAILEMDRAAGAFTDYFVVCSGTNPRQIQAISDEVEKELALIGTRPNSLEGYKQAEWVLLDYVDFVVHIFSERARSFYDLERLWKSARRLKPADLLKKAAKKRAATATPRGGRKRKTAATSSKPRAKAKKRSRKA